MRSSSAHYPSLRCDPAVHRRDPAGVNEACSNVLEHAATDDEYEVRVQIDGDQCVISVRNSGNGVDASALTDVMPDPSSPRGRGVAIMRAVMDHVDFSSEPDTGTVVHLVKTVTLHANAPATDLEARPRAADDSGRWGS